MSADVPVGDTADMAGVMSVARPLTCPLRCLEGLVASCKVLVGYVHDGLAVVVSCPLPAMTMHRPFRRRDRNAEAISKGFVAEGCRDHQCVGGHVRCAVRRQCPAAALDGQLTGVIEGRGKGGSARFAWQRKAASRARSVTLMDCRNRI